MLNFASPWWMLLLPLAGLAGWWRWRMKRPALTFGDTRLLAGLPIGRARRVRWLDALLHGLAVLALILALAGPRWPRPTPIRTEGIAIMLAVDVSGSMRETDFDWDSKPISRLDAVKRVFGLFVLGGAGPGGKSLPGRPNDHIGLITFATYPEAAAPLTPSHDVLVRLLEAEQPRPLDEAQTNIGDAVALAVHRLDSAGGRRKVLVLLSDGEHNFPGPVTAPTWSPRKSALRAADLGVTIHTIDAGTDKGVSDPAARNLGRESLLHLAQMTGGRSFHADDAQGLLQICQEIDQLERRPLDTSRYRRWRDLSGALGIASLLLFFVARLQETTIGRRLP